jgi:RNA polymerase sigma-70 factor, ECF subfamily
MTHAALLATDRGYTAGAMTSGDDASDPAGDQALLDAMVDGEAGAFDAIYHRYRDWVLRLARRLTGQEADALDVLQETFGYLARRGPGIRLRGTMTSFLYPVVKNLSIKAAQRRRRFVSDALMPDAASSPTSPDTAALEQLLARLPEPQREVLLMRFVDDLSLAEIADALRIPLGTVKSRLHNALASLRDDPRTAALLDP